MYRLLKSLYGLKQAPRAWFECFTTYFLELDFVASSANTSLFIRAWNGSITYHLLYVDDIILTGSHSIYIDDLVSKLKLKFEMTNLIALKYFLCLEISPFAAGIFVNQTKYASDLLKRFGMLTAKSCSTPLSLPHFSINNASCSVDDTCNYRFIIGALHYLTFTRLDISFAVSKLSQFMNSLSADHLIAAKRVLRYLVGSLSRGIVFHKSSSCFLTSHGLFGL